MLGMPALIVVLHALTIVFLSAGLSALSVGIGACLPNFRETDPSKIAVGFGGTLNLVVGLAFLVLTIGLLSLPWHGLMIAKEQPTLSVAGSWIVGLSALFGVIFGVCAVIAPLKMGIAALRRVEF
jgi:ABC-2 type transport system permease protein